MNAQPTSTDVQPVLHPHRKPRRWPAITLGVAIFLCGVVAGAGTTLYVVGKMIRTTMQHPEQSAQRLTQRLQKNLKLSPSQAEQIEAIITRHNRAILAIREEAFPRFAREVELLREEVAGVLDEQQAKQWREGIERDFSFFRPSVMAHVPSEQPIKHTTTP